jgi:hypothetical protein
VTLREGAGGPGQQSTGIVAEELEPHHQVQNQVKHAKASKKARRGIFLGLLLRLTVSGAVLGSAGAAAVVVSRERFGVDLVAESRRLAVAYGTIATRTSGVWVRQGSAAVCAWTSNLAGAVMRRNEGCRTDGSAAETAPEPTGETAGEPTGEPSGEN